MTNKNWMEEEYGVPHKNGHVRFYVIGMGEDEYEYLGWYDMTDWDLGWDKLMAYVLTRNHGEDFHILRHDQLIDLKNNVDWVLEEALQDKDETTFSWWYKKKNPKEET
jgi:hypothetical protein